MEPAIVCDFGSCFVKVGIAGESYPRYIIPTRYPSTLGIDFRQTDVEDLKIVILALLKRMQRLLMIKNGRNRSILICEDIMIPISLKKVLHQTLFDFLEFENIIWMPNSLLVMISVGLNRGLVVDIGFEQTSVIPVFDGYILYESHSHLFRSKENDSMEEEKRIEILARSQNRSSLNDYLLNLFIEGDRCVLLDSLLLTPITIRKDLASQIVICGGNALIPGISSFIISILLVHLKHPRYKPLQGLKFSIKSTSLSANALNWIGGSLFSSTKMQPQIEIKRHQYINGDECLIDWATRRMD